MYLHIGGNRMIDVRCLVALFKAHPSRASKANPLMQYYKPYEYVGNSTEKIGTYVVTEDAVYGSPLSLSTLVKRYEELFSVD